MRIEGRGASGPIRSAPATGSATGSTTSSQKDDPIPGWLLKATRPPISSARLREIARPSPVPPNLRL